MVPLHRAVSPTGAGFVDSMHFLSAYHLKTCLIPVGARSPVEEIGSTQNPCLSRGFCVILEKMEQQSPIQPQIAPEQAQDKHWRGLFVLFAIGLLGVFLAGLYWIFTASTSSPIGAGWFLFSFAAGLSMIVLPCTLPLAFVIVPLSMGKGYVKGLAIALAFGLGVAFTLSMYGVLAALLGKAVFGFAGAGGSGEIIKNIFYTIAGVFAMVFALGELGFVKARMPTYMGAAPGFIQKRKDITKALMLGLFLGNIGIGCPHPATPIILGQIGVTGDVFYGWLLFFVHAIGRIIPLLLLAILGILGVNATKALLRHKDKIARGTAWGMVFVGAFLFTLGFFSHDWWVASGQHTLLESFTQEERFTNIISAQLGAPPAHRHGVEEIVGKTGFFGLPLWMGNWVFVLLMIIPLWWYLAREQKRIFVLPEAERALPLAVLHSKRWSILLLSLLLIMVFTYALPQRFLSQAMMEEQEHAGAGMMMDESMPHEHGEDMMGEMMMADISKLPLRTPADRAGELSYIFTNEGMKEFRLEASEFRWEYEPGKWVHAWGYNNQIPGPTIRITEGDKVRVVVKNNLPDATSVHWHGVDVPWNMDGVPGVTQEAIQPGKTFTYEFTAGPSGTKFYHTHGKDHMTSAQQLDMGLSGALIIEPKKPAYAYDREYTLVLDEWDVQAGGMNTAVGHVHGAGEAGAVPEYNTFTINGRVFPYIEPLKVREGERVLIRMINAGTSAFHPMHLHGHNFTVVAEDGNAVPPAARQERNTFTVHPGETADILFTADNPGAAWLLHCHHVHHAAAGMIATVVYEGYQSLSQ